MIRKNRSILRFTVWSLLIGLLLNLAACNRRRDNADEENGDDPQTTYVKSAPEPRLFPPKQLAPSARVNRQAEKAIQDYSKFQTQLDQLAEIFQNPDRTESKWSDLASNDFEFVGVDLSKLRSIHRDGDFDVQSTETSLDQPTPPGEIESYLKSLAAVSGKKVLHSRINIQSIEATNAGWKTKFSGSLVGGKGLRPTHQATITGSLLWSAANADSPPRLSNLQIEQLHIAALQARKMPGLPADGALFSDCTDSVFKNVERPQELFGPDLQWWASRLSGCDPAGYNGICIADVNGDDREDIYLCQPGGLPNRLLIQQENGLVADVSIGSGVDILDESRSALFIDLDNDGDRDLAVATLHALVFFSNDGQGKFRLEHQMPDARDGFALSATDFNSDGRIDLYVTRYFPINQLDKLNVTPFVSMANENGGRNLLLKNTGGFQFQDITDQFGLNVDNNRFSVGAVWADCDADGDLDLYVINDGGSDCLYRRDADWFYSTAPEGTENSISASRSVSIADFDRNGKLDLLVGGITDSRFPFLSHSKLAMDPASRNSWVEPFAIGNRIVTSAEDGKPQQSKIIGMNGGWAFGSQAIDVNNDQLPDFHIGNGQTSGDRLDLSSEYATSLLPILFDRENTKGETRLIASYEFSHRLRQPHSFFGNQTDRLFLNLEGTAPIDVSNLAIPGQPSDTRAVVHVDWDNDGDLDIIQTQRTSPRIRFLRNDSNRTGNYVSLSLQGSTSNRDAIGAQVALYTAESETPIVQQTTAGQGFLSQSSGRVHFGLGAAEAIEKAVIRWPNGEEQVLNDLPINRHLRIQQPGQKRDKSTFEIVEHNPDASAIEPNGATQPPEYANLPDVEFLRPLPLTGLDFQISSDEWKWLATENQSYQLILFWSAQNDDSLKRIRSIAGAINELSNVNVDVTALNVDAPHTGTTIDTVKNAFSALDVPFECGQLTDSSFDKLMAVQSVISGTNAMPDCIWLIDSRIRLRARYFGDFDLGRLARDIELMEASPKWGLQSTTGYWVSQRSAADRIQLASRFERLGYSASGKKTLLFGKTELSNNFCDISRSLAAQGKYKDAITGLQNALALDPQNENIFIAEGDIAMLQVRIGIREPSDGYSHCRRAYERALAIDPKNRAALIGISTTHFGAQEFAEAEAWLKKLLAIDPDNWRMRSLLGDVYIANNQIDDAQRELKQAIRQNPNDLQSAIRLGLTYVEQENLDEAFRIFSDARKRNPNTSSIQVICAECEFLMGRFDDLTDRYSRFVDEFPNNSKLKLQLSWVLATATDEAIRDPKRALELAIAGSINTSDNSFWDYEVLAAAHAANSKFDEAIEIEQRAIAAAERYGYGKLDSTPLDMMNERLKSYQNQKAFHQSNPEQNPFIWSTNQRRNDLIKRYQKSRNQGDERDW